MAAKRELTKLTEDDTIKFSDEGEFGEPTDLSPIRSRLPVLSKGRRHTLALVTRWVVASAGC